MLVRRRELFGVVAKAVTFGICIFGIVPKSRACLYGSYWVVCPKDNSHVDRVDDGTCQHECEECKAQKIKTQCFDGAKVTLRCPNGHDGKVDTSKCGDACQGVTCGTCRVNCRIG